MPLFLNDFGVLSCAGHSNTELLNRIMAGDRSGFVKTEALSFAKSVYVGEIQADLPQIDPQYAHYACRNNQLLLAGLSQIETTVQQMISKFGANRVGVVLGTSTSGIRNTELALQAVTSQGKPSDTFHYKQQQLGAGADFLAYYLGLKAPAYTISTACSSSGRAFISAQRLIELDLCDAVVVGGADSLCRFTVNGFEALESVADGLCKPFGANREGINISEAVALCVLSKQEAEVKLAGIGTSSDAYHFSAPDPSGQSAINAMQMALDKAEKTVAEVDYINLHGTATPLNDAMESKAVAELFGEATAVSSTKGMTGHSLGASSALELGLCWQLLHQSTYDLPPNINDDEIDSQLPPLNFVQQGQIASQPITCCMSNSFAFGGNNVSIVIEKT